MRAPAPLAFALAVMSQIVSAADSASFVDCEARVRARPPDFETWRCFVTVAQRSNALDEAVRRLERHAAQGPGADGARLALGGIEAGRGGERAEALLRGALDGFSRNGDATGQLNSRLALADFLAGRGRVKEAEEFTAQAAAFATTAADRTLQTRVRLTQGYLARRKGDYGRSWLILGELESELFPGGPVWLQVSWFNNMAYVAWATGRHHEALTFYRRAADLLHREGDLSGEAAARGDIVFMGGVLGQKREERRELAREALEAASAAGNRRAESRAHYYFAETTVGPKALGHAREALRLARETKDRADLQMMLRAAGHLTWHVERDEEGYRLIAEALDLARETGSLDEAARDQVIRARMRWDGGAREEAIRDSLAALQAVEATRDLQPDSLTRARRFSQWSRLYRELSGHLLAGHLLPTGASPSPEDLELAFGTAERMRARMLLDELDAARASPVLFVSGPLEAKRDETLKAISQIQRELFDPKLAPDARAEALKRLTRAELEESSLRSQIERSNPAFAALRRPTHVTLRELRERLDDDEALLSYQDSPDTKGDDWQFAGGSWVVVVTRQRVRVLRLKELETLDNSLILFLGLCEGREGDENAGAARLYRDLLAGALAELPASVRRLAIVPDGLLYRLPFGALRPSAKESPIGERFEITTVPSATLWYRWKGGETRSAEAPALALADPRLPGDPANPSATSPERAWALSKAASFEPLRAARDEGRGIVNRLGAGSRLVVGNEASEAFVKKENLGRYRIVHFATHALLDDEHPERSAVLLAPGNDKEDGLLQLREIVKLDLKGRLVVLSGCRSASGVDIGGEGVVGLARAFFQAGATTVVGSLWPLRDDDAAAFFDRFYRHLANGRSVGGAVREAQQDRIRAGAPTAAWAGIVALGDGSALPFPRTSGGRIAWLAGGLAASVLAIGAFLLRRRT